MRSLDTLHTICACVSCQLQEICNTCSVHLVISLQDNRNLFVLFAPCLALQFANPGAVCVPMLQNAAQMSPVGNSEMAPWWMELLGKTLKLSFHSGMQAGKHKAL